MSSSRFTIIFYVSKTGVSIVLLMRSDFLWHLYITSKAARLLRSQWKGINRPTAVAGTVWLIASVTLAKDKYREMWGFLPHLRRNFRYCLRIWWDTRKRGWDLHGRLKYLKIGKIMIIMCFFDERTDLIKSCSYEILCGCFMLSGAV